MRPSQWRQVREIRRSGFNPLLSQVVHGVLQIDGVPTAHRNKKAALRFLKKTMRQHGFPAKVTIDKSGASTAGDRGPSRGNSSSHRNSSEQVLK